MTRVKLQTVITGIVLGALTGSAGSLAAPQLSRRPAAAPKEKERQGMVHSLGFVRPDVDLSHLTGRRTPRRFAAIQVPPRWDWREQGKVTPIKNQGLCGSCYAFAALANIESRLAVEGAGTFDFSENNAKECNWHGTSCDGGNYYDMANWLSKKGVVLESCDPYVASDVICNSTCPYTVNLLDWRIIAGSSIPATALLQQYIYTYGPVYSTLDASGDASWSAEFQTYDGSYTLCCDNCSSSNHAVLIVGWDDTLSHAGGAGAWIVKNSWGTGWGGTCGYGTEGGYFTIAYGSADIGTWSSYLHEWQDYDEDEEVMYHDEGGYSTSIGTGDLTAWGLCKFVPPSKIFVTRVDFWTSDVTTDVDIYIYDDFDGSSLSNLLASQLDTSFDEAGYHSVALDSPPEIAADNDIYAVVAFTNLSSTYPVAVDLDGPVAAGATYFSLTGGNGSWTELTTYDAAIRIRTAPTLIASVDDADEQLAHAWSLSYNYPNPFNPSTIINYTLQSQTHVDISVYNLLGQRVNTIVDKVERAGDHTACWDGKDYDGRRVASGFYFYQMKAGDFVESKKMLLLK